MKKSYPLLVLVLSAVTLTGCGKTTSKSSSGSASTSTSASSGNASSGTTSAGADETYDDALWTGKVKIYYHRDDGAYADKRLWVWAQGVGGDQFGETTFDNQDTVSSDEYGLYKVFDMSEAPWKGNVTTYISFIIKTAGTWKDQSADTECRFGKYVKQAVDNTITIYANAADGGIIETYAKKDDAMGDRIASVGFTDWKTLHVTGTGNPKDSAGSARSSADIGKCASYKLFALDASYYKLTTEEKTKRFADYFVKEGTPDSNAFDITFTEDIVPNKTYYVQAYFAQNPAKAKSKAASYSALYDTAAFQSNYVYSGSDLGATATDDETIFKLWAPTSSYVQVKVFLVGTPGDLMDPVTLAQNNGHTYDMTYGEKGVWTYDLKGDYLDNEYPYFYTYVITNSLGTNEVCDPYAKATGINGRRAAILDWKNLANPTSFDSVETNIPAITSPNQLSVYEVHVRDLTADKTWVSNNNNRNGTYGAFSETGTNYTSNGVTVKTGLDNIAEMKYNAVQLLPVFDQDNDERWLDASGKITNLGNAETASVTAPSYNWGYNPLNYNVVEGAYSANPYSPTKRVYEFKNLVGNYAANGMRVIMDVVYNHVSSANNSAFQKILPYYYFRTNSEGFFTNGSGVGNEIASQRPMVRSFIVDSLKWWATEYKIKGFRFDVMGVLDVDTMKAVSRAMYAIDPSIALYGEGWVADGSVDMADRTSDRAVAAACYTKLYPGQTDCPIGIGCFNSPGKQALKGEEHLGYGFMNKGNDWNSSDKDGVTYMLNGHMKSGSLDYANPTQTVNYASCHDNYTNYDQMNYTLSYGASSAPNADSTEAMEATVASCAAVMFSEGIAFTQGGEEIFRRKVMTSDDPYFNKVTDGDSVNLADGSKLMRNSYMYGDAVNSFKWDRKVTYNSYFEKFKEASVARSEQVSTILGRHYDATSQWGAQGVSGWSDAIDHGCGVAYQMLDNTAHYAYSFLIGRVNSSNYASAGGSVQVGMGAGTYKIIYSSSLLRSNQTSITVEDQVWKFTAYQNEFLVIQNY